MTLPYRYGLLLTLSALFLLGLAGNQTAQGVVTRNEAMCGTNTTRTAPTTLVPCTSFVLVGNKYWTKGPGWLFVKWEVAADPGDQLFVGSVPNNVDACNPNTFVPENGYANGGRQQCPVGLTSMGPFVLGSPTDLRVGIDELSPVVSVAASRPPDLNGWYRSPVTVTWTAIDPSPPPASGLAGCSPPVVQSTDTSSTGKDLLGTCADNVGNIGSKTITIKYDATPPVLTGVSAAPGGGGIVVQWQASGAANVQVVRLSSVNNGTPTVIYSSNSTSGSQVVDQGVTPGVVYSYEVTATDQAGNAAMETRSATVPNAAPAPSPTSPTLPPVITTGGNLLTPADGKVLAGAPVLRWPAVAKARFYNIQVFIRGKKVLSAWPKTTRYAMPYKWKYLRKRYRLPKGVKVRWYVWPAFGTLAAPKYGKLIGTSSFIFKR